MKRKLLMRMLLDNVGTRALTLPRKGWILPDGTVMDCRGVWHYQWVMANRLMLRKNHGIRIESDEACDENTVRLEAMAGGMFRIGQEDGRMIVQGLASKWSRRIKDTAMELFLDNKPKTVFVSLLKPDGTASREKESVDSVPFTEAVALGFLRLLKG